MMASMTDNYEQLLIFCCVVPVLVVIVLAFITVWTGYRFLSPILKTDATKMRLRYEALQQAYPNANRDELVNKVIHEQSMKCAWVGALTSFGGIFFLPFGLVIDIYTSLRIHTELVYFIAYMYGNHEIREGSQEQMVINQIITTGGSQAMAAFRRVMVWIAEKVFAKLIPIVGALLGFIVNYALTQATGRVAMQYYSRDWQQTLGSAQAGIADKIKRH